MRIYDDHDRPVADRRRGPSQREAPKKRPRCGLCNPLTLKTIIALARLFYELARIVLRQ